jgi:hypothetical protein
MGPMLLLRVLGGVGWVGLLGALGCAEEEAPPGGEGGKGPVGPVMLEPPASPEVGWQFDVPPFEVKLGEEIQDCYFFEVPYDVPTYVHKITLAQNEGSHHLNVFRVKTQKDLRGKHGDRVLGGECWKSINWADWPLVANMQSAGVNPWQLPEGVAHRFEPRELLMVQTHFVNATSQVTPLGGKATINFERIADDQVKHELGTAFATNQSIEICPGQKDKRFETSCKIARDTPITIVAANGHFHSRGRRFTMSVWDPFQGASESMFYESKAWNEPPFLRDLSVVVPPGGGVSYACEYTVPPSSCGDPEKECCFTFGPKVEQNEHCNAFLYYYPRRPDTDVNCF